MDEITKRTVKKTILKLRKLLEKEDIPAVLKQHGIFPDGRRIPTEKIALLDDVGRSRRDRLDAILEREIKLAGNDSKEGVKRYCREVAFTYLNRLIALRCMEVRGLIDECIKTRSDYAGRSLRHNRFRKENPGAHYDAEDNDGLKAFFCSIFRELQNDIKILFDPDDEYSIIMPSIKALRECIRALNEDIPEHAFKVPELIGWVYQYFQTEEKDRVFEEVRTKKKKIQGDDIVPATSLYTERYMVDYLVQNSLGAIWMEMYPDSKLCEKWDYFVKEQDLKPREPKPVKSLTFLDPACGSGHFLLIAFDLFVQMYEEEARLADEGKIPRDWVVSKEKVATTIIESNLHGIDIDLRSIQLSWLVLYLRMREHQSSIGVSKMPPEKVNLVAANASLLDTPEFLSWCEDRFKEEPYALNIIKGVANRLRNLPEIGSLARPEDDLKELIKKERERLLAGWEKNNGQLEMFAEFLPPEQRELPFNKVTDEQFWNGVLRRVMKAIDEYYREASEQGDTRAQIMTHEASKGFRFLEVCNKRYDVVATNPPYMGSKNMGKELKEYVQMTYPEGKRDLYAAFIQRNCEWTEKRGIVAMVTQQSWMFLRSYGKMRKDILSNLSIKTLSHLGSYCFTEISGAVVNAALFTIERNHPHVEHKMTAMKILAPDSPQKKAKLMLDIIKGLLNGFTFHPKQSKITKIYGSPVAYWLSDTLLDLLTSNNKLDSIISVKQGLITSDDPRFVRLFWEVDKNKRWYLYSKGGGFCRWAGLYNYMVDWESNGYRVRNAPNPRVQNEDFYFKHGFTYSKVSNRSIGVRVLLEESIIGAKGPGIFGNLDQRIDAILNSRLCTYLLRALSPTIEFTERNIESLPFAERWDNSLNNFAESCVCLKKNISAYDLTDFTYCVLFDESKKNIQSLICILIEQEEIYCSILLTIEAEIDKKTFDLFNVNSVDRRTIIEETGTPAGWYPLITGYDSIPETDICEIPKEVYVYLVNHNHINPSQEELSQIKSHLCALYEVGPGAKVENVVEDEEIETSDDKDKAEGLIDKRIPIPTETFLEELSVNMKIHPISIYWLLKELREKEGVVCWSECRQYVEDYFTVMILRILGFRWPKQVEAGEPIPEWADQDGIIPITDHTGEKTLLERVRDRIGAEFGEEKISAIEQEFSDILYNADCKDAEIKGKAQPKKKIFLGEWLEREFFRRHASQFKKRPIAWHLTSYNGTFQVLIFYHKLTADILKNLKNRYLSKVRQFYRVLLERARSGKTISGNLTVGKLQDIEAELENFAIKLDQVINLPYEPLIDDGVRVNIAPLQKVGLLKHPVLATKDVDLAISDRNRWREDDKEQETVWRI